MGELKAKGSCSGRPASLTPHWGLGLTGNVTAEAKLSKFASNQAALSSLSPAPPGPPRPGALPPRGSPAALRGQPPECTLALDVFPGFGGGNKRLNLCCRVILPGSPGKRPPQGRASPGAARLCTSLEMCLPTSRLTATTHKLFHKTRLEKPMLKSGRVV